MSAINVTTPKFFDKPTVVPPESVANFDASDRSWTYST
jgi:hypothetical protein